MSGYRGTGASILPEDVEEKLKKVQKIITDLGEQREKAEKDTEVAKTDLVVVLKSLEEANIKLSNVNSKCDVIEAEIKDRESRISQRESALDVYANALQEKEKKINKYLTVFENMKDVII
jgi:chromosome segregation ATPase